MAFGHAGADQRLSMAEIGRADIEKAGRLKPRLEAEGRPAAERGADDPSGADVCLNGDALGRARVDLPRRAGAGGWWPRPATPSATGAVVWLDPDKKRARASRTCPIPVQFLLFGGLVRSENRRLDWELDETGGEISF